MCDTIDPSVFRESFPEARHQHTCCECRGMIRVGETYQRVVGLWEGDWDTFATCLECVKWRRAVTEDRNPYPCTPGFGSLEEELREYHFYEGPVYPRRQQ